MDMMTKMICYSTPLQNDISDWVRMFGWMLDAVIQASNLLVLTAQTERSWNHLNFALSWDEVLSKYWVTCHVIREDYLLLLSMQSCLCVLHAIQSNQTSHSPLFCNGAKFNVCGIRHVCSSGRVSACPLGRHGIWTFEPNTNFSTHQVISNLWGYCMLISINGYLWIWCVAQVRTFGNMRQRHLAFSRRCKVQACMELSFLSLPRKRCKSDRSIIYHRCSSTVFASLPLLWSFRFACHLQCQPVGKRR